MNSATMLILKNITHINLGCH